MIKVFVLWFDNLQILDGKYASGSQDFDLLVERKEYGVVML